MQNNLFQNENENNNNVFSILHNLEKLSLKSDENIAESLSKSGNSSEEININRSSSIDYFRSSSIMNSDEELNINSECKKKFQSKNNFIPDDFNVISNVGIGGYSKVLRVQYKKTNEVLAVKVFSKSFMEKENKYYQIYIENELLNMCDHPNIIKTHGVYESDDMVCIVLENCDKGDLFKFIQNHKPLNIHVAKFFSAQILQSIEYLNKMNIVHRDLKPDNVVIDKDYILKIIDFSTATLYRKVFDDDELIFKDEEVFFNELEDLKKNENSESSESDEEKNKKIKQIHESESESDEEKFNLNYNKKLKYFKNQRFVGTAEYMAPELIHGRETGTYTDLWAFGCIIYECFVGVSPFRDKTQYLIFQKILHLKYDIDSRLIPDDAADLIRSLLKINPIERLGSGLTENNSFEKLKKHKFFENFNKMKYLEMLNIYNKINKKENISTYNSSIQENNINIVEIKAEKIIMEGILKKKSPWLFYDKRKIILFNTPRLDYFDPYTNILKGSILLNKNIYAELIDKNCFVLHTQNRKYRFMCKKQFDIAPWVISINNAIKTYSK